MDGPFARNHFAFTFRTDRWKRDSIVIPQHGHIAEAVTDLLSVLYGKHFEFHGMIQHNGHLQLPQNIDGTPAIEFNLPPFTHLPRVCVAVPLNLSETRRIAHLISGSRRLTDEQEEQRQIVMTAARFYRRALDSVGHRNELAFTDLVTCGEVLTHSTSLSDEQLYDDDFLKRMATIEAEVKGGAKTVCVIKSRLYSVKKRFTVGLRQNLDDYFFSASEAKLALTRISREHIERNLKAAYDLRSKYLHTGTPIENWIRNCASVCDEVATGNAACIDPDLKKIVDQTLTLSGLERIIRYNILVRLEHLGTDLHGTRDDLEEQPSAKANVVDRN